MTAGNKRARGDGGYRKRGDSWELKYSATDPKTGQRSRRYVTFKGTETAARVKLPCSAAATNLSMETRRYKMTSTDSI